jgi:hypothetical protein
VANFCVLNGLGEVLLAFLLQEIWCGCRYAKAVIFRTPPTLRGFLRDGGFAQKGR